MLMYCSVWSVEVQRKLVQVARDKVFNILVVRVVMTAKPHPLHSLPVSSDGPTTQAELFWIALGQITELWCTYGLGQKCSYNE